MASTSPLRQSSTTALALSSPSRSSTDFCSSVSMVRRDVLALRALLAVQFADHPADRVDLQLHRAGAAAQRQIVVFLHARRGRSRMPGRASIGSSRHVRPRSAAPRSRRHARASAPNGYCRVVPTSTRMPGRSGAFTSMRAMSSQVRNSRTMTGMKRRCRCTSRSMRARSWSASGTMRAKLSSVAPTSSVCSAISSARQFSGCRPPSRRTGRAAARAAARSAGR